MALQVEIFAAPGCSRCKRASALVREIAAELGESRIAWREVDVLAEMDRAVSLGVMATPAIVVDGERIFTGLPTRQQLEAALRTRLP